MSKLRPEMRFPSASINCDYNASPSLHVMRQLIQPLLQLTPIDYWASDKDWGGDCGTMWLDYLRILVLCWCRLLLINYRKSHLDCYFVAIYATLNTKWRKLLRLYNGLKLSTLCRCSGILWFEMQLCWLWLATKELVKVKVKWKCYDCRLCM